MNITFKPLLYLLLCAQAGAADRPAAPVAGEVIDVQRRCELRKSATGKAVRVKIADVLTAGDRVSCEASGSLTYRALQSLAPVRVAIVPPGFHMVLNTPLKAPDPDENRGGRSASRGLPPTDAKTPQQFAASMPDRTLVGSVLGGLLGSFGGSTRGMASKAGLDDCEINPITLVISDPTPGDDQAQRTVSWIHQIAQKQRCIEIITAQALASKGVGATLKRDKAVELTVAPSSSDAVQLILKHYGQERPIASTVRTLDTQPDSLAPGQKDQQGLSDDLRFLMLQNPPPDSGVR